MNNLVEVLAQREGMTHAEVIRLIQDTLSDYVDDEVVDYETILFEDFGLEPDYIMDLIALDPFRLTV